MQDCGYVDCSTLLLCCMWVDFNNRQSFWLPTMYMCNTTNILLKYIVWCAVRFHSTCNNHIDKYHYTHAGYNTSLFLVNKMLLLETNTHLLNAKHYILTNNTSKTSMMSYIYICNAYRAQKTVDQHHMTTHIKQYVFSHILQPDR